MIGTIIGTYRITDKLGDGGLGVVYKAVDQATGREAAFRMFTQEVSRDPMLADRLRAMAPALKKLQHPNIAGFYELITIGADLAVFMEYVPGSKLDQVRSQAAQLEVNVAVSCAVQILRALEFSHATGVLHHALRPSNVMVTPQGTAKVMDFGIGHAFGANRKTREDRLLNVLAYLAPEQIQNQSGDARSDIYSVGVILYELLTGRLPFDHRTEFALRQAHLNEPPAPPRARMPNLPEWLDQAVMKTLAKNPASRYQNATECRAVLEAALGLSTSKAAAVVRDAGGATVAMFSAAPPIPGTSVPPPPAAPPALQEQTRIAAAAAPPATVPVQPSASGATPPPAAAPKPSAAMDATVVMAAPTPASDTRLQPTVAVETPSPAETKPAAIAPSHPPAADVPSAATAAATFAVSTVDAAELAPKEAAVPPAPKAPAKPDARKAAGKAASAAASGKRSRLVIALLLVVLVLGGAAAAFFVWTRSQPSPAAQDQAADETASTQAPAEPPPSASAAPIDAAATSAPPVSTVPPPGSAPAPGSAAAQPAATAPARTAKPKSAAPGPTPASAVATPAPAAVAPEPVPPPPPPPKSAAHIVNLPDVSFRKVKLVGVSGGVEQTTDVVLMFLEDRMTVTPTAGGTSLRSVRYGDVTGAAYAKEEKRRLGLIKSAQHLLTVDTGTEPLLLRLDKDNVEAILSALEARTSKSVSR